VRFGSSPRGVQALMMAAKVRAMLDGRYHIAFDDLASSYLPALRHRVMLNFEGQAEGVISDDVLKEILKTVPKTSEQSAKA
jgi:MoxR-like ATPase